jgi:hypothetical protein
MNFIDSFTCHLPSLSCMHHRSSVVILFDYLKNWISPFVLANILFTITKGVWARFICLKFFRLIVCCPLGPQHFLYLVLRTALGVKIESHYSLGYTH